MPSRALWTLSCAVAAVVSLGGSTRVGAETGGIIVPDIGYEAETLDNGLRVVFAPMENAPVVHVRVLYHVGSRDEREDRQGFAHLFEHMMFRGSRHVASEEHMRRINGVGGSSNAFTSFDQTTYVNTVPANALEMALWLEADRMASFKVDAEKFTTERSVVNEEYLQRVANPPYGRQFIDFFGLAFTESNYRWTPIGDMDQLARAETDELQDFFDTYYVPNNAVLVVAGQFDVGEARQWVESYFGWIPRGDDVPRPSRPEPEQDERREKRVFNERAPLAQLTLGWKSGGWRDEDAPALEMLGTILGTGRSSRLYQALVSGRDGEPPVAASASAGFYELEDAGVTTVVVTALPGQDANAVEERVEAEIERIKADGVTEAELDRARTQMKIGLLRGMETADNVAATLAEAWAFGGDTAEVARRRDLIDAITADDLQRVAREYLTPERVSSLHILPGRDPSADPVAEAEATAREAAEAAQEVLESGTVERVRREVTFPDVYPTAAPVPDDVISATFDSGEAFEVEGVDVIVIRDTRLPLVGVTLLNGGFAADNLPPERHGIGGLAADLMGRGSAGRSASEQDELFDGMGLALAARSAGDHTEISATFPKAALDDAAGYLNDLLARPNMDAGEFRNLQARATAALQQALSDPSGVAAREASQRLFGDAPAGRQLTPAALAAFTAEDAQDFARRAFAINDATLILAGDVTRDEAEAFARKALADLPRGDEQPAGDDVYALDGYERRVLLVDNPGGGQSAVRLANRAFTVDDDRKYAGNVAIQILAAGIESRLNQALRAEKGLTYGAGGRFTSGRHAGDFAVGFSTRPETTAEAIRTAHEVLVRMASEDVTPEELADAQRRVAGSLVLSQQTVGQLAGLRGSIVLNDFPPDYYDRYADKVAAVTASDVRNIIAEFASPDDLTLVVVAPAATTREQVAEFGEPEVVAMPLAREGR